MIAGALTGGNVRVLHARFDLLHSLIDKMREAVVEVGRVKNGIEVKSAPKLNAGT
jgi:UDP-N-acetylglucosamine 1-carboxyvinyltransferase